MHIPDSMLEGNVCTVTAVASIVGIAAAAYACRRAASKPSASLFAAVTALIFAAQMMNFPVMQGTSGHLLGGVLAASILGTPFGIVSVAVVVVIQTLLFADGGVTVLGANLFNMALIGAGLGGWMRTQLLYRLGDQPSASIFATACAAWGSVVIASVAVSAQLAMDGQAAFMSVLPAMVGTHLLIGVGEAGLTVAAYAAFSSLGATASSSAPQQGRVALPVGVALLIGLLLSPFASGWPDGLEWVGERYQFLHESAPVFAGPLPDYTLPLINHPFWSTGLAGGVGVLLSLSVAWLVACFLGRRPVRPTTV